MGHHVIYCFFCSSKNAKIITCQSFYIDTNGQHFTQTGLHKLICASIHAIIYSCLRNIVINSY